MNKKIISRIVLDILIAANILNGWWFIALPLGLIGAWSFSYFAELVLAGLAYDSLFGFAAADGAWGYAGTIVSILLIAGAGVFKKVVRR